MTFRNIMTAIVISLSLNANAQAREPSGNSKKTDQRPTYSIYALPPFERAICCIKFYEGIHRKKDYPYVGYGHKLKPGEKYSSNMSLAEADLLLRKDLKELCAVFRSYGKDEYLEALEAAANTNSLPTLYESTDAPEDVVQKSRALNNVYNSSHF